MGFAAWRCVGWSVVVALAACGGSVDSGPGDDDVTTSSVAAEAPLVEESAPPPPAADVATPAGAVSALDDVKSAVVRIVGTGSFADPAGDLQANVPGSGSGFVVDPSGLVVTNNHVVTGAAKLDVYVAGEDEPRNARVLGVSECSDLAVIQLGDAVGADPEDVLPYLSWHDGPVVAGMQIYAAGFPLGDAEFTLLDGIVSKEDVDGDTSWSSVRAVIEHSADTLPGNSGGPIVTADGRVVAVNFAGNDLGQSFGIGGDVARPVVDQLAAGHDVNSIGINGEALFDAAMTGIWVASVQSGSPADVAGVRAGDVVVSMESILLGGDGTMGDYCDVLRSHDADATMGIEVYRPAEDRNYVGQLNGRELEPVGGEPVDDAPTPTEPPAPDPPETTDPPTTDPPAPEPGPDLTLPAAPPYEEFVEIADESGLITATVPAAWSDVNGAVWDSPGRLPGGGDPMGPALSAAPDLQGMLERWDTPGVFIGATAAPTFTDEAFLDEIWFGESCEYLGRTAYDDGFYTGYQDVYQGCGGLPTMFHVIVAGPPDRMWLALVEITVVTDADVPVVDEIIRTFVIRDLGG